MPQSPDHLESDQIFFGQGAGNGFEENLPGVMSRKPIKVTRKNFVQGLILAAGSGVLAACAPGVGAPTEVPTGTPEFALLDGKTPVFDLDPSLIETAKTAFTDLNFTPEVALVTKPITVQLTDGTQASYGLGLFAGTVEVPEGKGRSYAVPYVAEGLFDKLDANQQRKLALFERSPGGVSHITKINVNLDTLTYPPPSLDPKPIASYTVQHGPSGDYFASMNINGTDIKPNKASAPIFTSIYKDGKPAPNRTDKAQQALDEWGEHVFAGLWQPNADIAKNLDVKPLAAGSVFLRTNGNPDGSKTDSEQVALPLLVLPGGSQMVVDGKVFTTQGSLATLVGSDGVVPKLADISAKADELELVHLTPEFQADGTVHWVNPNTKDSVYVSTQDGASAWAVNGKDAKGGLELVPIVGNLKVPEVEILGGDKTAVMFAVSYGKGDVYEIPSQVQKELTPTTPQQWAAMERPKLSDETEIPWNTAIKVHYAKTSKDYVIIPAFLKAVAEFPNTGGLGGTYISPVLEFPARGGSNFLIPAEQKNNYAHGFNFTTFDLKNNALPVEWTEGDIQLEDLRAESKENIMQIAKYQEALKRQVGKVVLCMFQSYSEDDWADRLDAIRNGSLLMPGGGQVDATPGSTPDLILPHA